MMAFHRIRHLLKQKRPLQRVWVTDGVANNDEVRRSLIIRMTLRMLAWAKDGYLK